MPFSQLNASQQLNIFSDTYLPQLRSQRLSCNPTTPQSSSSGTYQEIQASEQHPPALGMQGSLSLGNDGALFSSIQNHESSQFITNTLINDKNNSYYITPQSSPTYSITPSDLQLYLPSTSPVSPLDAITSQSYPISPPFDYSPRCSKRNSVGFLDNTPTPSTSQLPTLPDMNAIPPPPILSFLDDSLISFTDCGEELNLYSELPAMDEFRSNEMLDHAWQPSLDMQSVPNSQNFEPDCQDISKMYKSEPQPLKLMYPSPSLTPKKSATPLPQLLTPTSLPRPGHILGRKPTRTKKSNVSRRIRSKPCAIKREVDSSPLARFNPLAHDGISTKDVCPYGYRKLVFDDKSGEQVLKWTCIHCSAVTGRKPDLHRHYKTCVIQEKFYCQDVVHLDGSVWPGCGMMFSRRDACHRHLKKRFTEGRCSKIKPRQALYDTPKEYAKKVEDYEDMLRNFSWRSELPPKEKNRLARTALQQIKVDMF